MIAIETGSFKLESQSLVAYRRKPYAFTLKSCGNEIRTELKVIISDNYSIGGTIEIVKFMRDLSLLTNEVWTVEQVKAAKKAKTIFLYYGSFNEIFVEFCNERKTPEELQNIFGGNQIFVSHDISEIGLNRVVSDFLEYLETTNPDL